MIAIWSLESSYRPEIALKGYQPVGSGHRVSAWPPVSPPRTGSWAQQDPTVKGADRELSPATGDQWQLVRCLSRGLRIEPSTASTRYIEPVPR